MYNAHRPQQPNSSRILELLDQLRQEYENQTRSNGEIEHQCTILFFPRPLLTSCAKLTILSSVVASR
jgi:hypothetical protein